MSHRPVLFGDFIREQPSEAISLHRVSRDDVRAAVVGMKDPASIPINNHQIRNFILSRHPHEWLKII